MQWFTPMIGLFHSWATVRATIATDTRGAPMPGPATIFEVIITTYTQWHDRNGHLKQNLKNFWSSEDSISAGLKPNKTASKMVIFHPIYIEHSNVYRQLGQRSNRISIQIMQFLSVKNRVRWNLKRAHICNSSIAIPPNSFKGLHGDFCHQGRYTEISQKS
jgi:hypothetical protein